MAETSQLGLPLVQAAQAQKHVTVNEALMRLDGLTQTIIASRGVTMPPAVASEGQIWAVPVGATDAWQGREGQLALFINGGWEFVVPKAGWRGWIADECVPATFDGTAWRAGAVALSPNNAGSFFRVAEFDHVLDAGSESTTFEMIPTGSMLFAVTARVVEPIGGDLTGWQLGNPEALDRFGTGLGLKKGSWARGLLSAPMSFYVPTPLVLGALGGSFSSGRIRFALHLYEVALPAL